MYRNTRYMCIILVANIIWRSGNAIRSSYLLDFSFLHHSCRRVFTVSTSQPCNMIVLAARLMGTLFGRQIVLSMHQKNWPRRTRQALKSIISNYEYSYQPKRSKTKFRVIGTLKERRFLEGGGVFIALLYRFCRN